MQPSAQALLLLLLGCAAPPASSLAPSALDREDWPWSKRTPAPAPVEKAAEPAPEKTQPAQEDVPPAPEKEVAAELAPGKAEQAPEKTEPATEEALEPASGKTEPTTEGALEPASEKAEPALEDLLPASEKTEPATEKASEEASDAAEASGVEPKKLKEPTRPGCYMRMASGCPNNPMDTARWRRDTYAEKRGFGEERCQRRRGTWNSYCGSEDAQMVFVANETRSEPLSALQISATWQWPWSRSKKVAEEKQAEAPVPAVEQTTLAADKESAVKSPTRPGCYMRMPSGCPKRPMQTRLWRHDTWAEQHGLDEAGCQKRGAVWNGFCESQDAMMAFVPGQ